MRIFWVYIFSLPSMVLAQQFELRLDRQELTIGDQESLHLSIDPAIQIDTIDAQSWEATGIEWLSVLSTENTQTLRFTIFDTGYIVLPPLVAVAGGDTLYSNDLAINVLSVATDSTNIAPIKNIVQEPISFWDFAPFVLGYIMLVGGLLYIAHLRREKKKIEREVIEVYRPAHEIALQKLRLLENDGLWQKGEIKAYQSGLTYIIREYLENRFKIHALESTTEEILTSPEIRSIDPTQKDSLQNILNIADLVKFAKAKPTAEVHQQFMDLAKEFVVRTKKVEVENVESTTED